MTNVCVLVGKISGQEISYIPVRSVCVCVCVRGVGGGMDRNSKLQACVMPFEYNFPFLSSQRPASPLLRSQD